MTSMSTFFTKGISSESDEISLGTYLGVLMGRDVGIYFDANMELISKMRLINKFSLCSQDYNFNKLHLREVGNKHLNY